MSRKRLRQKYLTCILKEAFEGFIGLKEQIWCYFSSHKGMWYTKTGSIIITYSMTIPEKIDLMPTVVANLIKGLLYQGLVYNVTTIFNVFVE